MKKGDWVITPTGFYTKVDRVDGAYLWGNWYRFMDNKLFINSCAIVGSCKIYHPSKAELIAYLSQRIEG